MKLTDFYRGELSPRLLSVLIRRLPGTSELARSIDPDAASIASWGSVEYLLADLWDLQAHAHFKDPQPYPRPADIIEARKKREAREAALEAQNERIRRQLETGGAR